MASIRVLYILGQSMRRGGTEAFIMNYYRHMDHSRVIVDFVYQGNERGVYDDELTDGGSRIYHVPYKSKQPIRFTKEVTKIIKEGRYRIVHSQMDAMGVWPLMIAKRVGVPVRIAHSHSTHHHTRFWLKVYWNNLAKILLRGVANVYFSCGEDAGRFLFGNKLFDNGKVRIIHNAIEVEKYKFCREKRNAYSKGIRLINEFTIGHVGRFSGEKNHRFLLEIFNEIQQRSSWKCKLILVGEGILKVEMQRYAEELGIQDHVIFTGARNDVDAMLSAFDVFLFPSLYEGLSVVAIEAQCNGLPCVFSSSISRETVVTDLVTQISLEESVKLWVQAIMNVYRCDGKNSKYDIQKAGYDINIEAKKLEDLYLELEKGR